MASYENVSTDPVEDKPLDQNLTVHTSNSNKKVHLNPDKVLQGLNSNHDEESNSVISPNVDNKIINYDEENEKQNEEKFHLELDKINRDLQVKPSHWTDEYWKEITTKYRWFLHKDDYAGCKLCLDIRLFMGKKSRLSCMKLFIMNLSYEEFEQNLELHNTNFQHIKCEEYFKESRNLYVKKDVVHLKTPKRLLNDSKSFDYSCPQCFKGYKFKKSLTNHLSSCDAKYKLLFHNLPCKCPIQNIYSLSSFDKHITDVHSDNYQYVCQICSLELCKTAGLFEHLFLKHDYFWNPFDEFPQVKMKGEIIRLGNMRVDTDGNQSFSSRQSSISNLENVRRDSVDGGNSINVKRGKKRVFKEITLETQNSFKKPMQEMTNFSSSNSFTIDLNMIVVCPICEGRYLTETVLKSHMERYHPN